MTFTLFPLGHVRVIHKFESVELMQSYQVVTLQMT